MRTDAAEAARRVRALESFLPDFVRTTPELKSFAPGGGLVVHGSTTFGFADPSADLDAWLFVPQSTDVLDRAMPTRFFEFQLEGVKGHVTVEPLDETHARVKAGDLPLIYELRRAHVVGPADARIRQILDLARSPMPDAFRRSRFMFCYVEMRGEHRAADTPIDRGDRVALLLAIGKTLERAMQAAMVLDGEPYPYVKWLSWASRQTPSGQAIAPHVDALLDAISEGALSAAGPERDHPVTRHLKAIRHALVDQALRSGVDARWLREWWLAIPQARAAHDAVAWGEERPPERDPIG